jgi:hypothetical protein
MVNGRTILQKSETFKIYCHFLNIEGKIVEECILGVLNVFFAEILTKI